MPMRSIALLLVLSSTLLHLPAQALPAVQRHADATPVAAAPMAADWLARFRAWLGR